MKKYTNIEELAESMDVPLGALTATFNSHAKYALGSEKDPFGKSMTFIICTEYNIADPLREQRTLPIRISTSTNRSLSH